MMLLYQRALSQKGGVAPAETIRSLCHAYIRPVAVPFLRQRRSEGSSQTPRDRHHATLHRKHAITRRIRSTTRRFFPGELRGDVLHGRLTVHELSERGVFVRQDQPAMLRLHVDPRAGGEA